MDRDSDHRPLIGSVGMSFDYSFKETILGSEALFVKKQRLIENAECEASPSFSTHTVSNPIRRFWYVVNSRFVGIKRLWPELYTV